MTASDIHATRPNPFREAMRKGRPLIGIWSMLNSVDATEALGWSGYDWLLVDGEHAPVSLHDAMAHCRAIAATPTIPIVRLLWNDPLLIKQHLDAGIATMMLPFVQTPDEARRAVQSLRYPPHGIRGIAAMHRASRYTRFKDYAARASESSSSSCRSRPRRRSLAARRSLQWMESMPSSSGPATLPPAWACPARPPTPT